MRNAGVKLYLIIGLRDGALLGEKRSLCWLASCRFATRRDVVPFLVTTGVGDTASVGCGAETGRGLAVVLGPGSGGRMKVVFCLAAGVGWEMYENV